MTRSSHRLAIVKLHRQRRVMLVTGASGFLGRHLVRGPVGAEWEIIAPASSAMDITNRAQTLDTISGWKPDVVAHLAYRKDRRTIVDGSRHVAEACLATHCRLVHMSTDVVFGGRPTPYTERDIPDPLIEYGIDKRDAELAVAAIDPTAAILRTSLLYGTDTPSPFQTELASALSRGRSNMTFFTDEFRCPVHAADVARAIGAVASRPDVGGVLHVAGPDRVSRLDYAHALARHSGFPHAELPRSTVFESGQVRARNVVLDSSLATTLGITTRGLAEALTN
jgi:dTDP-4-dehydrorhamnose reductase